jgi:hypothetical protein
MVLPAIAVERALAGPIRWFESAASAPGASTSEFAITVVSLTLSVGIVEECAKWFGAWSLASHRPEFDEPVDGIVYACASALGFAAVENIADFAFGRMSSGIVAVRAFVTVPTHMFLASLWGYAMGRRLVSRKKTVPAMLACSALAHGLFDASLAIRGFAMGAVAIELVLGSVFVLCVARALRHGAIGAPSVEADSDESPRSLMARAYFRVGSGVAFVSCASAMVLLALSLTVVATAYDGRQARVGWKFVFISTAMLTGFAFTALGIAANLPLDAALDARGLTFAGKFLSWSSIADARIERLGRSRSSVRLELVDGTSVNIGPATGARADDILRAIVLALGCR